MKVIMRSDDTLDVGIEANEWVRMVRLDQHIRTLLTARRWLKREMDEKKKREAAVNKK